MGTHPSILAGKFQRQRRLASTAHEVAKSNSVVTDYTKQKFRGFPKAGRDGIKTWFLASPSKTLSQNKLAKCQRVLGFINRCVAKCHDRG